MFGGVDAETVDVILEFLKDRVAMKCYMSLKEHYQVE